MSRAAAALLLLLAALARPAVAGAQVAPDASWRTIVTPHFRVNYPEALDGLARHAADRAEAAYALLQRELPHAPARRIELTIADNVDFANGYATPFPTNRIVVYAHPPIDAPELAYYTDWVGIVVLHELVHVFQLDTSGGVWEALRAAFGRNPAVFPEVYSPPWLKEGLAVYYESHLTPAGRLRGTLHDMVLRTAALEDDLFPIDRASSDPVLWPAGNTRYVYGGHFLEYLARQRGRASIPAFVGRLGREIVPFYSDHAARDALGVSFSRAWRAWTDSLDARYGALADSLRARGITEPEVLTREGRGSGFPRYAPDGSALAYASTTGRRQATERLLLADGGTRDLGRLNTLGPVAWTPDSRSLLLPQLEYVDPYRIHSDLWLQPLDGERERRTRGARIWETDLSRDGRSVVGVGDAGGTNALVLHDLASGRTRALLPPSPDRHWSLPRWSPDGSRIAVGRWSPGGYYDVVLVDTAGTVTRELTHDRAVDAAPAWSPDGRWVVFSSDRTGIPNLYAFDLRDGRLLQVTDLLTGAAEPDVSPDGRWIAFAYYRADGWHIARVPFEPERWPAAPPVRLEAAVAADSATLDGRVTLPSRPYSAFPSVLPASWSPIADAPRDLGLQLGVAVGGEDAVGRHAWAADASTFVDDARFDGGAAYRWAGLGNPVVDLSVSQRWTLYAASGAVDPAIATAILRRDRRAALAATWVRRRFDSYAWLGGAGELRHLVYAWKDPAAADGRELLTYPADAALRASAGVSTARGFALSIGRQKGFTLSGGAELHRYLRPLEGEDETRGYLRLAGRGRSYLTLPRVDFAHSVLALRADFGADEGSRSPGFSVGGASGGAPLPIQLSALGDGLDFPVRGYPEGTQFGNRAAVAGVEYRVPLALVQRGFRLAPIFLDRVWADVFADAGAAWCAGACAAFGRAADHPSPLTSVGAELVADLQLGFGADLPLRFGVAAPLRAPYRGSPEFYLRAGIAY
jgi:hypothetical protein